MDEIKINQRLVLDLHNQIAQNQNEQKKPSFKETMKEALNEVNNLQITAKDSVGKFLCCSSDTYWYPIRHFMRIRF